MKCEIYLCWEEESECTIDDQIDKITTCASTCLPIGSLVSVGKGKAPFQQLKEENGMLKSALAYHMSIEHGIADPRSSTNYRTRSGSI